MFAQSRLPVLLHMSLSQTLADRERLLAAEPFFTHDQVAKRYGSVAALEAAQESKRLIVGRYKGSWVYPAFQFVDSGPAPATVARLVPHLPSEPQDGGWTGIFWCFQPHLDLDERSPAEAFEENQDAVIAAAEAEKAGPADSGW
jgi:hypothetical protein